MSLLEATIRGGTRNRNRNLDMTLETTYDLSASQYRPVSIFTDGTAIPYSGPGDVIAGILQNKGDDGIAEIRYVGVTRLYIGADMAAGQLVMLDPNTGDGVPFGLSIDGHTHAQNSAEPILPERLLVRVTNMLTGAGVTGLTASEIEVRHFYRPSIGFGAGTIQEESSSVYVEEDGDGDGWYEVGTSDAALTTNIPHRLSISLVGMPTAQVTPAEHSWTSRINLVGGPPQFTDVDQIFGRTLETGVTGDYPLVQLIPQLF